MARQYSVVDHMDFEARTFHPSADDALAHGRTLAAALAAAQGLARVIGEPCEDGTLLFGQHGDNYPDGMPGDLVALVWVDELGRGARHGT